MTEGARVSASASKAPLPASAPRAAATNDAASFTPLLLAGNQQLLQALGTRTKLSTSQPDDPDEQEADRVADRIMRMEDTGHIGSSSGAIHRKCAACETDGEEERVQLKDNAGATSRQGPPPHSQIAQFHRGGEPLSPPVRAFFEPRFGHDFSNVRVHTDSDAAKSSQQLGARAFALGTDIAFAAGEFSPDSASGRRLLAHELAHVAQSPQRTIARAVAGGYSTIQSDLTYGVVDWAITEAECDEVLGILTSLSPTDIEDTVRRMQTEGLVTRLTENVSATARTANATLLRRIQEIARGTAGSASTGSPAMEPVPEVAVRAPETFDPCLVDVYALANAGLLSYYQRALAVVNRGRDASGYFDNRNLQRRLITERNRRADLGHYWLATMPDAVPETLYRLGNGPSGSFRVVEVPGSTVAGLPEDISSSPLGTRAQFDHFLAENNIERVDANTYMVRRPPPEVASPSMLGTSWALGGLYNAPGDLPLLWRPRGAFPLAPGEIAPWPLLPEALSRPEAYSGHPLFMQQYFMENPPPMNPEVLSQLEAMLENYRNAPGVPPRPRSSLILNPNEPVTTGTAAAAITDIPNLGRARVGGASAAALPEGLRGAPGTTGGSILVPANPTAVNHAEHVALENLRIQIDQALALGDITRVDLRGRSVYLMVEQEPCSSCASGAAEGPPGVLEQFARRYPELTIEVRNLRTSRSYIFRGGVLLNPSREAPTLPIDIPPPAGRGVESVMTPEYARTLRYGGGASGELRAMGVSGLQGAGLSGVLAVGTAAGIMVFDTRDHPEWAQELALTGGLGVGAGFLGSGTEQLIISRGTSSMVSSIVETGASRLSPGMVTGLGRAGGGAVGAMFVEGISMGLLEEREHFAPEIATRTVRSGLLGAGSVWAGAGAGAAIGSVVPVAGTAVGFVVGLVVGGVLYYAGDRVVPGGREDWDAYEAGCHFRPTPTSAGDRGLGGYCFTGDTPVRMADGTHRRIDALREGDAVLSFNEHDASLHPARVMKIVRRIAPDHLVLHLAEGGTKVGVTGEHPIYTEGRWMPAKMLRVGSTVTWLGNGTGKVGETEIANVTTDSCPTDVYDLSVSVYHTFFAGGILAHNKNM